MNYLPGFEAADESGERKRILKQLVADNKAVQDHYRTQNPRSRPGAKEKRLIAARLQDGYSVEDLCEAIDGCFSSPFHSGENDNGRTYRSLELIMRNSGKVDQFLDLFARKNEPVLSERTKRTQLAADGVRARFGDFLPFLPKDDQELLG